MRFPTPLLAVLAAAFLQSAFSASLRSAEEARRGHDDALTELRKIDQLEFEAAQKDDGVQLNITEKRGEDGRYLEAATTDESVEVRREDSVRDAAGEVRGETLSDAAAVGGRSSSDAAAPEKGANCSEEMAADEQRQPTPARPQGTSEDGKDSTKEQEELQ